MMTEDSLSFFSSAQERCIAADPRHSPVWQSVAKDLANTGKSTEEILKLVAEKLE
jgi:pre-mRNA-processing factor 6